MFGAAALNTGGSGEEHSCEDIDWGPGQASPRGGRGAWGPFSMRGVRGRGGRGASMRGRGQSPPLRPFTQADATQLPLWSIVDKFYTSPYLSQPP